MGLEEGKQWEGRKGSPLNAACVAVLSKAKSFKLEQVDSTVRYHRSPSKKTQASSCSQVRAVLGILLAGQKGNQSRCDHSIQEPRLGGAKECPHGSKIRKTPGAALVPFPSLWLTRSGSTLGVTSCRKHSPPCHPCPGE